MKTNHVKRLYWNRNSVFGEINTLMYGTAIMMMNKLFRKHKGYLAASSDNGQSVWRVREELY